MKVALVHPTNWPYVRRGTERFMNELASFLGARGHQVTIVSSKAGWGRSSHQEGYQTKFYPRLWHPWLARVGVHEYHVFPLTTLYALLRRRYDLVHCFNFTDALVATWLRSSTGAPVLLHLTLVPEKVPYRRALTLGGRLLERAVLGADEVLTVSRFQSDYYESRFRRKCVRLPAPVDLSSFQVSVERDQQRPRILFAGAAHDRRKGARCLVRAFNHIKARCPAAILQFSTTVDENLRSELMSLVEPRWRDDMEFFNCGRISELPGLYSRAAVVVVPSMWEVFPLVILESLASGTPVVGTHDGGIPELLSDPRVGRTFEPGPLSGPEPSNVEGLAAAVLDTLALSRRPDTPMRCRAFAERFGWETLGPRYESLYQEMAGLERSREGADDASGQRSRRDESNLGNESLRGMP